MSIFGITRRTRGRLAWLFAALALVGAADNASATTMCWEVTSFNACGVNRTGTWSTYEAAAGDAVAACVAAFPTTVSASDTYSYSFTLTTCSPSGAPSASATSSNCGITKVTTDAQSAAYYGSGAHTTNTTTTVYSTEGASNVTCPSSPCTALSGTISPTGAGGSGSSIPSSFCDTATMCMMRPSGVGVAVHGAWFSGGTYDGQQCSAGQAGNSGQCVTSGGVQACTDTNGCVTVNGDKVCTSGSAAPAPGTCEAFASGGVACSGTGTSPPVAPPAPLASSGGGMASPTAAISAGQGSSSPSAIDYFNSTTVGASSGPTVSTVAPATSGSGSGASGSGSGASSAPVDDCQEGANCTGSVPTLPTQNDIPTSTNNYMQALYAIPLVAAVNGIVASVPTGTCPTGTFSVYGVTYTINEQCTLWTSVSSIVGLIMLAVWTFMGVRILMSA